MKLIKISILAALSFGAWIAFTLNFSVTSLAVGGVLAVLTGMYAAPVFFESNQLQKGDIFFRFDLLLLYFLYVIIQSYTGSIALIKAMITGNYNPGMVRVKTRLKSPLGRMLLANTISFVPGTLSIWTRGDHIHVHWFNRTTTHAKKASRSIAGPLEGLLRRITG